MYTGDYELDEDTAADCIGACRWHGEIGSAAKKYNIKFLPELAECKFKQTAWNSV